MIIFKDIISGDEIFSDSYRYKEIDGIVYEADAKNITLGDDKIDIGANPSAEEGEEALDSNATTVIDIIHSFRLQSTQFDKASYLSHLKGFMKAIKEKMTTQGKSEDEIKDFQTKAQAFAKKVVSNIKDYDFYVGESMNPDGMIVLLNYREDGITPFVTVWKHGLEEMKV